MKKYVVMKASIEMTRSHYRKEGGYRKYIAAMNDTEQEILAITDTLEEAKKLLDGKTSSITPYPFNGIADIEEYYIEEYQYDDDTEINEDDNLCFMFLHFDAKNMGDSYVAPLDEYSRKFVKDIYVKHE